MMKTIAFPLVAPLALCLLTANSPSAAAKPPGLEAVFDQPPAEAKPFLRWWWNGNRVREDELARELDLMQSAGIGGFEINPIAQPEGCQAMDDPALEWLSPEWVRRVQFTAAEARRRGLVADLIVGSGWPFGGEFLQPQEWSQRLFTGRIKLQGPATRTLGKNDLLATLPREKHRNWEKAPEPELLYIFVAPENPASLDDCKDVTADARDKDSFTIQIPPGKHILHIGMVRRGFSEVMHGAPGAAGPVLDHYNAAALGTYLKRMSDALNPALGGKMGDQIRAVFCDSIELSRANWTGDFEETFRNRMGYDLRPWLPFVADFEHPAPVAPGWEASVQGVRYDYSRVLVDVFLERFVKTYHNWCHAQGTLSRYQAYGSPWLPGMFEGFLIPDIPETNSWIYSNGFRGHGYRVWTKYATSAGHIRGRKIVSSESMTNTRGVFKTTLELIKSEDDMNFIMGVNHSVLHGWNYSPPEAGFPGWVRYGTYFNEHNTWWPYFPRWAAYNARISAVFQATQPVMPLAILGPQANLWSRHGLERGPFHTKPWYVNQIWEAAANCGVGADYIGEAILPESRAENGMLVCDQAAYRALVVADATLLEPTSAAALRRFADAGGRIAFVNTVPSAAPGWHDAEQRSRATQTAMEELLRAAPERIVQVPPPADEAALLAWTQDLLNKLALQDAVAIPRPDPAVFLVHRQGMGRDVFFVSNQSRQRMEPALALHAPDNAWLWNPETGARQPLGGSRKGGTLHLPVVLDPLESMLIVMGPEADMSKPPAVAAAMGAPLPAGKWKVDFKPVTGGPFTQEMDRLLPLQESRDPRVANFAGVAIYRTTFDLPADQPAFLDLGTVHGITEVSLNGKPLGTRWYGRHLYPLAGTAKPKGNQLEIRLTTTLFNYARTLLDDPAIKPWISPGAAQNPEPAGLLGPLQSVPMVSHP